MSARAFSKSAACLVDQAWDDIEFSNNDTRRAKYRYIGVPSSYVCLRSVLSPLSIQCR